MYATFIFSYYPAILSVKNETVKFDAIKNESAASCNRLSRLLSEILIKTSLDKKFITA